MKNEAQNLVHEFLSAVQTGNFERVGALLDPEVIWEQPGKNRFSGKKISLQEVFGMVGGMSELSGNTLALTDVKTVMANGDMVACLVHWKAANPFGGELDVDNIDVYTVRDGKIIEAKVFSADPAQEDRFWGE
jgi:hypothetical protein